LVDELEKGNTKSRPPKKRAPVPKYKAKLVQNLQEYGGECEVCQSPFVHVHRIKPGRWGGIYEECNVALFCPNHHAMIHFVMNWHLADKECPTPAKEAQLEFCLRDDAFWSFWKEIIRPVVLTRQRERWAKGLKP
jgi:hypothetical protein